MGRYGHGSGDPTEFSSPMSREVPHVSLCSACSSVYSIGVKRSCYTLEKQGGVYPPPRHGAGSTIRAQQEVWPHKNGAANPWCGSTQKSRQSPFKSWGFL